MKKSIFTFALLATMSAIAHPLTDIAVNLTAQKLVEVLRSASPDGYVALYPSVQEFHNLMKANASVYGPNLKEAQEEFETQHNTKMLPSLKASFAALIKEGEAKGIVWSEVEFLSTEAGKHPGGDLSTATFTLAISHNGKVYGIVIDNALLLNGKWHVSKYIRFS